MSDLLAGTTGLVVGVANKRSIAWAIAKACDAAGARQVLTYQGERTEQDVRKLAATLEHCAGVLPLDVQDDTGAQAAVDEAATLLDGHIDTLVHAVAYAQPDDLGGRFVDTSREGFQLALDISAYSLASLARFAEPHMKERGGSIMALSYIAADRAVPGYNVMGVAKAALECIVRYLAWDLGESGIRVNAISAGPVRTLAARGIPGFSTMADTINARTPLRRAITADEVAATAVYLASPLAEAVTGETLFVDAGFHAMGL
ncbi:MAG TPA: enoyl-ACP reductase [Miltoncostaeaceae bacterium]|nr:enoyl-ACP reductase [Miltoncostaeaceae bacterium]